MIILDLLVYFCYLKLFIGRGYLGGVCRWRREGICVEGGVNKVKENLGVCYF